MVEVGMAKNGGKGQEVRKLKLHPSYQHRFLSVATPGPDKSCHRIQAWVTSVSCYVVSNSLQPHELQHTSLPCPSLSPGVCSKFISIDSVMLSNHLILCLPLLLLPSIFPSIKVFSSEKTWGGQSTEASASVLPMNIQGWFLLGLTGLISLQSKGLSRVFSSTTIRKYQFFVTQPSI